MKKTSYLLTSPVQTQRVSFTACIKNHAQRLADTLTEWIFGLHGRRVEQRGDKARHPRGGGPDGDSAAHTHASAGKGAARALAGHQHLSVPPHQRLNACHQQNQYTSGLRHSARHDRQPLCGTCTHGSKSTRPKGSKFSGFFNR